MSPRFGSSRPSNQALVDSDHSSSIVAGSSTNSTRPATESQLPASATLMLTCGFVRSALAWSPSRARKNQTSASSVTSCAVIGCARILPSAKAVASITELLPRRILITSAWPSSFVAASPAGLFPAPPGAWPPSVSSLAETPPEAEVLPVDEPPGCGRIVGVGCCGARRTASGSAGDRVAHAGCTVDIVGLTGRTHSRAHARGNGSVIVRPLAGIGTAASRCIVSGSAGDCPAHAGCTVDVVGLSGGADSRAHTRGYGGIKLLVLILVPIGLRGSLAGIGFRGRLGGSRFVDRCVRSIRIAMQRHPLLFGGGLGAILNVLLGVSDPGVRFHVRGPGKRRGRLVQLGCDVACLLLGSGLVTRISVDHDHFP